MPAWEREDCVNLYRLMYAGHCYRNPRVEGAMRCVGVCFRCYNTWVCYGLSHTVGVAGLFVLVMSRQTHRHSIITGIWLVLFLEEKNKFHGYG